jgi:hypothetical protein
MQICQIWRFLEKHMTRTLQHSKKEKNRRPQSAGYQGRSVGGFFIIRYVHIGGYAWFVCGSLVVMVIALSMPFEYTCVPDAVEEPAEQFGLKRLIMIGVVVLALAGGGVFAYKKFRERR